LFASTQQKVDGGHSAARRAAMYQFSKKQVHK